MSVIALGGLFLVLGALFVYHGKVFYSTFAYVIADLCWVANAFEKGDLIGIITVNVGIFVGLVVMWKMQQGIFHKDLRIKEKIDDKK